MATKKHRLVGDELADFRGQLRVWMDRRDAEAAEQVEAKLALGSVMGRIEFADTEIKRLSKIVSQGWRWIEDAPVVEAGNELLPGIATPPEPGSPPDAPLPSAESGPVADAPTNADSILILRVPTTDDYEPRLLAEDGAPRIAVLPRSTPLSASEVGRLDGNTWLLDCAGARAPMSGDDVTEMMAMRIRRRMDNEIAWTDDALDAYCAAYRAEVEPLPAPAVKRTRTR